MGWDLGILQDESTPGCLGNNVPAQRTGQGEACRHANLWRQEASKSGRFVTKKGDTSVNPADLMTKPTPTARIEQLMSLMRYEFMSAETSALKSHPTRT